MKTEGYGAAYLTYKIYDVSYFQLVTANGKGYPMKNALAEAAELMIQFRAAGEPESLKGIRDRGTETPLQMTERFARYETAPGLLLFHARNVTAPALGKILSEAGFALVDASVQRRIGDAEHAFRPFGVHSVYGFRFVKDEKPQHIATDHFANFLARRWQIAHGHWGNPDRPRYLGIRFNHEIPFPRNFRLFDAEEWGLARVHNCKRSGRAA